MHHSAQILQKLGDVLKHHLKAGTVFLFFSARLIANKVDEAISHPAESQIHEESQEEHDLRYLGTVCWAVPPFTSEVLKFTRIALQKLLKGYQLT